MRSPWPANSCKRRQPWIGEKGHLERDIAVIGGHKIIPGKNFHFSPVYASALPSPARPRQKVLTVSSRPDVGFSFRHICKRPTASMPSVREGRLITDSLRGTEAKGSLWEIA